MRLAVVVDAVGWSMATPEQERDQVVSDLAEHGIEAEVIHFGHDPRELPETQIDMLVVDYGALWQNHQLVDDDTRFVLQWAEDHPNTLVGVWSSMTADIFASELDERRGRFEDRPDKRYGTVAYEITSVDEAGPLAWPANIRALHAGVHYGLWPKDGDAEKKTDWFGDSWNFIQRWFEVPEGTFIFAAGTEPTDLVTPSGWDDEEETEK